MRLRAFLLALAALAWTAPAWAHNDDHDCDARFAPPARVLATFTDPLTSNVAIEPFTLRLQGLSDPSCRFEISFEDAHGQDGLRRNDSRRRLDYRIALDAAGAAIVYDSRRPNAPFTAHGVFSADGRLNLFLIVDGGSQPRAGEYSETLRAELRPLGSHRSTAETQLSLAAFVPAHVQAYLAGVPGAGGVYTLDFAELSTGETGTAALRVRATADIDVTVTSENGGRLMHEAGASAIPYTVRIGSETLDLGASAAGAAPRRTEARFGQHHGGGHDDDDAAGLDAPLEIRIGDTTRAAAGQYHDRITITVSAR